MVLKDKIKIGVLITGIITIMSFPVLAEGWDISTGSWRWIDDQGQMATDTWKSANGSWFYLDSNGSITKNKLIVEETADGTNSYYVDGNGVLLRDSWKAVAIDPSERKNYEAEYWWYYFGHDGKAYKSVGTLTSEQVKTIEGKQYAFDRNGHMLYGWINIYSVEQQDYNHRAWEDSDYYFGTWDAGHAREGWQQLKVCVDDDGTTKDYWFYFDKYGKKAKSEKRKIDNYNYYFEEDGHMAKSWDVTS